MCKLAPHDRPKVCGTRRTRTSPAFLPAFIASFRKYHHLHPRLHIFSVAVTPENEHKWSDRMQALTVELTELRRAFNTLAVESRAYQSKAGLLQTEIDTRLLTPFFSSHPSTRERYVCFCCGGPAPSESRRLFSCSVSCCGVFSPPLTEAGVPLPSSYSQCARRLYRVLALAGLVVR